MVKNIKVLSQYLSEVEREIENLILNIIKFQEQVI